MKMIKFIISCTSLASLVGCAMLKQPQKSNPNLSASPASQMRETRNPADDHETGANQGGINASTLTANSKVLYTSNASGDVDGERSAYKSVVDAKPWNFSRGLFFEGDYSLTFVFGIGIVDGKAQCIGEHWREYDDLCKWATTVSKPQWVEFVNSETVCIGTGSKVECSWKGAPICSSPNEDYCAPKSQQSDVSTYTGGSLRFTSPQGLAITPDTYFVVPGSYCVGCGTPMYKGLIDAICAVQNQRIICTSDKYTKLYSGLTNVVGVLGGKAQYSLAKTFVTTNGLAVTTNGLDVTNKRYGPITWDLIQLPAGEVVDAALQVGRESLLMTRSNSIYSIENSRVRVAKLNQPLLAVYPKSYQGRVVLSAYTAKVIKGEEFYVPLEKAVRFEKAGKVKINTIPQP